MQTIQGWLFDEEAELLIGAAELALRELQAPHVIVEVGSFCGRSTIVLARTVKALSKRARVYAIDPHQGEIGTADAVEHAGSTFEEFTANVNRFGMTDVVQPIRSRSYETDWKRPVSLLFIDGLHDYDNVARDFRHFEPWLVDRALIAFHDYTDRYPGVMAFVEELLGAGGYEQTDRARSMMLLRVAAS